MLNLGKSVDLVKLTQEAYALSKPQGMGFLHYRPGVLTADEAKSCIRQSYGDIVLDLDYVLGRAVKLTVRQDESGEFYIDEHNDMWFDHGPFDELFKRCGIVATKRQKA